MMFVGWEIKHWYVYSLNYDIKVSKMAEIQVLEIEILTAVNVI